MSMFLALASAAAAVSAAGYGVFRFFSRGSPEPEETIEASVSISHRELQQRDATISRTHSQLVIEGDWVLIERIETSVGSSSSSAVPGDDHATGGNLRKRDHAAAREDSPSSAGSKSPPPPPPPKPGKIPAEDSPAKTSPPPPPPPKPGRSPDGEAAKQEDSPPKTPPPPPPKPGRSPEASDEKEDTPSSGSKTQPPVPPAKPERSPERKKQVAPNVPAKPPRSKPSQPASAKHAFLSELNAVLPVAFDKSQLSPLRSGGVVPNGSAVASDAERVGERAVTFEQPATSPKLKSPSRNKGPSRRPPSRKIMQEQSFS